MKIHIFNPEHDLALASGLENFTAPHAGRQLHHDLAWLPALWASQEDVVILDNPNQAVKAERRLRCISGKGHMFPHFAVSNLSQYCFDNSLEIDPWGWNPALRAHLIRLGIPETLMPSAKQLNDIRILSHRRTARQLLKQIKECIGSALLIGDVCEAVSSNEVEKWLNEHRRIVIKAPWSSSGRGVKFVEEHLSDSNAGWLKNTLKNQGSVMVEKCYSKIKDFGMEFMSDGKGHIVFQGLSLFETQNGAYTGNLLATEKYKLQQLSKYTDNELLRDVRDAVCQLLAPTLGCSYSGPFGIDMMIAKEGLHPCVEINLRRTMGHVALALHKLINPASDDEAVATMRITYENDEYKLKIRKKRISG